MMRRQLAQEIKMRNRRREESTTSEIYKDILASSNQMSEQIEHDIKCYTTFFINLRELCVSNLYPDATYRRRRSSLQILLLAQDLLHNDFEDIEWKKEEAETMFQCLLLDTYETNKEMAYQILKSMCSTLLRLNSETHVRLIIKVALELGKSIRPIDSVTAAYMLKISKLSPIMKNVLCNYYDVEDNVKEAMTLRLVLLLHGKLQVCMGYFCLLILLSKVIFSISILCLRMRQRQRNKTWERRSLSVPCTDICFA